MATVGMSAINEFVLDYYWVVVPIFLGVTTFRIAWRNDWGWIRGLLLTGIIVGIALFCWPFGMLGAAVIVGKLYQSYG